MILIPIGQFIVLKGINFYDLFGGNKDFLKIDPEFAALHLHMLEEILFPTSCHAWNFS